MDNCDKAGSNAAGIIPNAEAPKFARKKYEEDAMPAIRETLRLLLVEISRRDISSVKRSRSCLFPCGF